MCSPAQSTDEDVLASVSRKNITTDDLIKVAKEGESLGLNSFSELILCLPGDSKEAHFTSCFKLMDAGINVIRSHQFVMLMGAAASTPYDRDRFDMKTKYRVVPQTFSKYKLFGKTFLAPEIDEICVANRTMPFADYLECRKFNLTIEIFYNDGVFSGLLQFLRSRNIPISSFMLNVHEAIQRDEGPLSAVYQKFVVESKTLWDRPEDVHKDLSNPEVVKQILSGDLCFNEQLVFRAVALTHHMEALQHVAFGVVIDLLKECGGIDGKYDAYLKELAVFSLLKKRNVLDTDAKYREKFTFDFIKLEQTNFEHDPLIFSNSTGIEIEFQHSSEQVDFIAKYIDIYGTSDYGVGTIISAMSNFPRLYREVREPAG